MNISSINNYPNSNTFKANVVMNYPEFKEYFYKYVGKSAYAREIVNKFKDFKPNENVEFYHDFDSTTIRFFAKNLGNKKSLSVVLPHAEGECIGNLHLMERLMDKSSIWFWEKSGNSGLGGIELPTKESYEKLRNKILLSTL